MIDENVRFSVLVLNDEVRSHVFNLLSKNELFNFGVVSLNELIDPRKKKAGSIILIDCESVLAYGVAVISKIKASCPASRLILLCCQAHRNLIERVMELGAYGCIVEPYREWEFSTMVRRIPGSLKIDKQANTAEDKRKDKKSKEK